MNHRTLTPDELDALKAFAADYGKQWKQHLSMVYWYNARIYRDRAGRQWHQLHTLRNEFGPSWLATFKLPKD